VNRVGLASVNVSEGDALCVDSHPKMGPEGLPAIAELHLC
jgi:hypothetical protein